MRRSTRMMLMTGRNNRDYGRSEENRSGRMDGGEMNYGRSYGGEMYGGDRGRRGGYSPRSSYPRMETEYETTRNEYNGAGMNYGVEGRFRDRRGREHYDNGRFAPMRSELDEDDMEGHMPYYPAPVWGDPGMTGGIMAGFSGERGFRSDAGYQPRSEMDTRYAPMERGGFRGEEVQPMTRQKAEAWVSKMKNADGSTGQHWTMEKVRQLAQQKSLDVDPVELWVTMNMLYSDYGKVAQKHGLQSNVDFFVDMAQAFLDDKDAQPEKLARYYQYIAKK